MRTLFKNIENSQARFYKDKLLQHKSGPKALSWNDEDTQFLRFEQLSRLFRFEGDRAFSVHDVGCGFADFRFFLEGKKFNFEYSGSDILPEMVNNAKKRFPDSEFTVANISDDLINTSNKSKNKDYYCASGLFYTKQNHSNSEWKNFVQKSITNMYQICRKGISFNLLTSHSDFKDKKLYYSSPEEMLEWCIVRLSRFTELSQTCPLYEFTVYIYKKEFMAIKFPGFNKYFRNP